MIKIKKLKGGVILKTFKDGSKAFYFNEDKIPRKNSIVKLNIKINEIDKRFRKKFPFKQKDVYIFLGEIVNMQGHCIVMHYKTGKIYAGWHSNYFSEINATMKINI